MKQFHSFLYEEDNQIKESKLQLEKHDEFIMMTRALIGRLKGRVVLNIT
jgi:hypothetical protein